MVSPGYDDLSGSALVVSYETLFENIYSKLIATIPMNECVNSMAPGRFKQNFR